MKLLLLLLCSRAWALPSDCVAEQRLNVAGLNASYTAIANWTATPTPTPTLTPTQVACGNTVRIAQYGDSHQLGNGSGPNCFAESDGYRAVMIGALKAVAIQAKMVGSVTAPSSGSHLDCPKTDAISGSDMATIYATLDSTIDTNFSTPTANDIAIIGGGVAAQILGASEAQIEAGAKALITRTAAVSPNVKILVTIPPNTVYASTLPARNAYTNAYNWAVSEGYNVYWFNANAVMGPQYQCTDDLHWTVAGYTVWGEAIATTITAMLP